MTREEYQALLQSDYWKGYSYSLIKERNFTCEDCGRSFYNERNKLQVHHLVYRDINPWSYKPEEMVVLCEDCHRRRHGLPPKNEEYSYNTFDTTTYSNSSFTGYSAQTIKDDSYRYAGLYPQRSDRNTKIRFVLICIILLGAVMGIEFYLGNNRDKENKRHNKVEYVSKKIKSTPREVIKDTEKKTNDKQNTKAKTKPRQKTNDYDDLDVLKDFEKASLDKIEEDLPSSEIKLSERKNNSSEKRELSTLEILERRNHAEVVKQAKRAGVSTEGSTIDILERINHAEVVKQAKRAGVSTEGSTIDILERINNKEMKKYQ